MKIEDCKAIVAGGASGLGEGCVRNIVDASGQASIFDLHADRAAKLISELGSNAIFASTDVHQRRESWV